MPIEELREGAALANTIGVEVMRWTPKNGEWYHRGEAIGLKLPTSDELKAGEFRPDLSWNSVRMLLIPFAYWELFRAPADRKQEANLPAMRKGQWCCRLLEVGPPTVDQAELYFVADTLALAVCGAALKASKWIWSDADEKT